MYSHGSSVLNSDELKKECSRGSTSSLGLLACSILVVCIAVMAVHWPALSAGALSFDDSQYLTKNKLVQNPGWSSAQRFLSEVLEPSTVHGYYHPLSMISLMTDYALGGSPENLMPFHRMSLILHMANTGLVIVLLYLLFGRALICASVGLLFGLHPMTVETIAWVGERKTVLTAFFALWSLIFYVCFARKRNLGFYIGCVVTYILALMSKPTCTPLPVLMLLMDYWPLGKLTWRSVLEKLPLFAIGAVSAMITYISQSRSCVVTLPVEYGPWRIPLVLCHNIVFYLWKIIWPVNLSSHYAFPSPMGISHPMVAAGIIGSFILIILLAVSLIWTRAAMISWLFFFIAALPTMQIIGFSNVIASDKFAYLPSVGLMMGLVSLLCWFCGVKKSGRFVFVTVVILALAVGETRATRRYLVRWDDTETFFNYMLDLTPDAAPLHNHLGAALAKQNRTDEAIGHYRRALEITDDYARAHNNLGLALKKQGHLDEAIDHYRKAVEYYPGFAEAHYHLGNALRAQNKLDEAIEHYHRAIEIQSDYINAYNNLANALVSQKKYPEAIEQYQKIIEIDSNDARVYNNLGNVMLLTRRFDEALEYFRKAVSLKSDYILPMNVIARVLTSHPDKNERDPVEAVEFAERAAKLTGRKDARILETLALAYSANEEYELAISTAEEALSIAEKAQNEKLSKRISRKLEFYKKQKP